MEKTITNKIIIPIQSYSDIITNSSSELFCIVTSDQYLQKIYQVLFNIFGNIDEDDLQIRINSKNQLDSDELEMEFYKNLPNNWIEIAYPQYKTKLIPFYKAGLEALLNDTINKQNYNIKYIED